MMLLLASLLIQAAAPATALNPHANQMFDRDPVLRAWAVRNHDRNGDGWLTMYEAQEAVRALKDIADGNGDGRVTTYEFGRAREFIRARY